MSLIFKDKQIRRQMFSLAIPFLFQELIVTLTSFLTPIMVNPFVGVDVVSGIGAAGNIYFLYNITVGALVFIGNLFMSQHYGKEKYYRVELDYYLSLKIVGALSIIFFVLSMAIPSQLIAIFIPEQTEAIAYGAEYLRIFSISFLFTGFSLIDYCFMKNTGLEKYATANSLITLGVLASLNAIFMFASKLGLTGAALALVISRFIELMLNAIFIQAKGDVTFHFSEFIKRNPRLFKEFFKHGGPLTIGKLSWAAGFMMTSIIMGQLHSEDISAANAIATNALNIVMCIPNCMTATLGVMVGRRLGANKLNEAQECTEQILKFIGVLSAICIAIILLIIPIAMAMSPNITSKAMRYLWIFFLIIALTFVPRTFNGPMENGIINAGGDTLYITILDGLAAWLTVVPLGFAGIYLNWNPIAIYFILNCEEIIKFPINIWRYKTKKWVKNITHNNKSSLIIN